MKLATLREGGPDGTLIVVDRGLTRAVRVPKVAATLQGALDDWQRCAAPLEAVSARLNAGDAVPGAFDLDVGRLAAPLPRAYQFADGSAYLHHVAQVRRARGAEVPASFHEDPLMYQALSDGLLGPRDPIELADENWGIDFEAELAVITDRVPMGTRAAAAPRHFRLFMLLNDVSLRNLIPAELAKGFGFFQGKPTTAFSPVAVTADEFGASWDGTTVDLPLLSTLRGAPFGHPRVSVDCAFPLARLVEHCARTRHLGAGTIIGTGTVSNATPGVGASCIAEVRAAETIATGTAVTPFMRFGDTVRIEMLDADGRSIFGAIEQTVVRYQPPA